MRRSSQIPPLAVISCAAMACLVTGSEEAVATPPQLKGVFGVDDRVYIRDLSKSSWVRKLASPVGRVLFSNPAGTSVSCTGFVLSHEYVMTNYHCAFERDGRPRQAQKIILGYLGGGEGGTYTNLKPTVVESSGDLDYAIVEFAKWETTTAVYGKVTISKRQPQTGDDLLLIGHPKGRPLQVSEVGCKVVEEDQYQAALAHTCDSEPGSSGSPMFDARDGKVVAINFGGYDDARGPNVATPIAAIAPVSPIIRSLLPRDQKKKTDPKEPAPVKTSHSLDKMALVLAGAVAVAVLGALAAWRLLSSALQNTAKRKRDRSHRRPRRRDRAQAGVRTALRRIVNEDTMRRPRRRQKSVSWGA